MQLNEIREKYTIKEISYHTNISENNLEKVLEKDFSTLRKLQALGFISIIEREYKADLSELESEVRAYYAQFTPEVGATVGLSNTISKEKKEKSRGFTLIILLLLAYATWYFLTQFDREHLSKLMPFIDESTVGKLVQSSEKNGSTPLPIVEQSVQEEQEPTTLEVKESDEPIVLKSASSSSEGTQASATSALVESLVETEDSKPQTQEISDPKEIVSIVPHNRLWFGLIDLESKSRDHFSVADTYALDVSNKQWLVATSSASFTLESSAGKEEFTDNQEHYFLISKEEIKSLSKSEYVSLGGWKQW
jgi:hypothetical protein